MSQLEQMQRAVEEFLAEPMPHGSATFDTWKRTLEDWPCSSPGSGVSARRCWVVENILSIFIDNNGQEDLVKPVEPKDEGFVFVARLRRGAGEKLGLDLEYVSQRRVIPIKAVTGHAAKEWNRTQPQLAIRSGDVIVSVGEASEDAEQMRSALASPPSGEQEIWIARLSANRIWCEDEDFVSVFRRHRQCDGQLVPKAERTTSMDSMSIAASMAEEARLEALVENQQTPSIPNDVKLQEARTNLPEPWCAVWSNSQKRVYFHNHHTGENVWVSPQKVQKSSSGALTACIDFDIDSDVGTWKYPEGMYCIYKQNGRLMYEETQFGLIGEMTDEEHGCFMCKLRDAKSNREQSDFRSQGDCIGILRLKRNADIMVSSFRLDEGAEWEQEIMAQRVR